METVNSGAALGSVQTADQVVGTELLEAPKIPIVTKTLVALYGSDFPLAKDEEPTRSDWVNWADSLWKRHSGAMMPRLFLNERNRLFRRGIQWISASASGNWREPPSPRDQVRAVENLVAPALDLRVQIISEQRPGYRANPASNDPTDTKRAEAQQAALEYQHDNQGMDEIIREAAYWAGTDGAAFLELYWDAYAGPWHELPLNPMDPNSATIKQPLGDVRTRVRRVEQVRVSAEATATHKPHYVVIREVIPAAEAANLYGSDVIETASDAPLSFNSVIPSSGLFRHGLELPTQTQLLRDQRTVERTVVYVEPCEYIPKGITVITVGNSAPLVGPLYPGTIPVVRFTDGSSDPAYFPSPIMELWIDSQMRVNTIKSRWIEAVRAGGGKVIAREGAVIGESFTSGQTQVVTVRDARPFDDLVKTMQMPSVGNDAMQLMAAERKQFEDLSGWNDVTRGQFSSETSGRAILAIREQLERVFAPPVNAAALAMTGWAKISLAWMRWGYDMPRLLAVQGSSRPDLAREVVSDDFDGVVDVFIDPETMMPMPRSLRLFLLNDMANRQLISPQELRRRMPFASLREITTPDDDQESRARRVVEAIRQSGNPMALPLLWQDDESIHQDIIQRELILPDNADPAIRQAAIMRWDALGQQAMMKAQMTGQMTAQPANPMDQQGQQPVGQAGQLPPTSAPIPSDNAGVALQPVQAENLMGAVQQTPDESTVARQFDQFTNSGNGL
jgi:hypothetical protein